MRWFVLAVAVLALVCGCGSSTLSAPTLTTPHGFPRGVPVVARLSASQREAAAARSAEHLLNRIAMPSDAVRVTTGYPFSLHYSAIGTSIFSELAQVHRIWKLRESEWDFASFMKRHPVPGFTNGGSGIDFVQRSSHGWTGAQHQYNTQLASANGWTFVRIDAAAAWNDPRSPREVVPPTVREIGIHGDGVNRTVTDPARVARIVGWFNHLNVMTDAMGYIKCGLAYPAHRVEFTFRAADRSRIASASVPAGLAHGCDPISFTLRGKTQTPLIDSHFGRDTFAGRVQRLLGVCFRDLLRKCK